MPVTAAAVTCSAAVDGTPVAAAAQSFADGRATCGWSTAASAGGRALTGTIAVTEPQSGLTASTPFTTQLVDRTRPTVRALAGSGRFASVVPLRVVASDESGAVALRFRVYRGSTIVATRTRAAAAGATVSFGWAAPRSAAGPFHFCVTATDKSGNAATSCAAIRLS